MNNVNIAQAWKKHLIRCSEDDDSTPKPILANAITALRTAPEWKGVLAFDEFALRTIAAKPAPWPSSEKGSVWTDQDDSLTAEWLQRQSIFVNSKIAAEAVETVAHEHSFHCVRDYLYALERDDKKPLLDNWLHTYLGAPDNGYTRAVGRRWLISAVARIFEPGCQADHTLLSIGIQGKYKSSGFRVLAVRDGWFADHLSAFGSKDSREELLGKWIVELAELEKVREGKLEKLKSFLVTRVDHYRPPYGRRAQDVARQCVFAGSVNGATPLTDETGNRRFWPVECSEINLAALEGDRDQLWAEARDAYWKQEPWWLETAQLDSLARIEQDQHYDPGVWDDTIAQWLQRPYARRDTAGRVCGDGFYSCSERVTITDILVHAIGKDLEDCKPIDHKQAARCLRHLGWELKQDRGKHRGRRFYVRPKEQ